MSYQTPITDADLHAYVDGELSPDRCKQVEAYLQDNPLAARKVAEIKRINAGLADLYDPIQAEAIPAQLAVNTRRPARLLRIAAAVGWMALGGLIAWTLGPNETRVNIVEHPLQTHLVQPAAFAHSVYSTEIRHPVEVAGEEEQHLVAWLSKRLRTDIRAPSLSAQGYALMGGRLLPSTNRMAAQFMYERPDGMRVTLYIRQGKWDNDATAFRFARHNSTGVFYWVDGPLAYALVGELSRNELLTLSETVFPQLIAPKQ